jgi:hypothetical protein
MGVIMSDVNVIVDLRSIRIEATEEDVENYYKGNAEAMDKIRTLVREKVEEVNDPAFFGDNLIEGLEIE